MAVTLTIIALSYGWFVLWIKRLKDRQEMEHSVTPEVLFTLLASNRDVLVFDVRLPLDLLADSEIQLHAQHHRATGQRLGLAED